MWPSAVPCSVVLKTAFRQRDGGFIALLNDIRTGSPSEKTLSALRSSLRPRSDAAGSACGKHAASGSSSLVATKLFSRNAEVDAVNARELERLPGNSITFEALDSGDESHLATLAKNCGEDISSSLHALHSR